MSGTSSRMIIVGGRQRKGAIDKDEWHAYESAVILCLDPATGELQSKIEYSSPAEVCPDSQPAIVFKAGDLHPEKNRLLLCTQTEILEYDTNDWSQTFYYSHRSFNDLHHACYSDSDRILIANTGLDQVVELQLNRDQNSESSILQSWSFGASETWNQFDQSIDYRKVASTKPHHAHPNFIFKFQNKTFVTRFHQKDAIALDDPNLTFPITIGNPHDGIVTSDQVVFTTTDGNVVMFNAANQPAAGIIDLNAITASKDKLGWCRGIAFEDPQTIWVGFSRFRPTLHRKYLSKKYLKWLKKRFKSGGSYGSMPTRVAKYDITSKRLLKQIDLEQHGLNCVFGIYFH